MLGRVQIASYHTDHQRKATKFGEKMGEGEGYV